MKRAIGCTLLAAAVWLVRVAAPARTFRALDVRLDVGAGRAVDSRGRWLDEHDLSPYLDDGALLRLTRVEKIRWRADDQVGLWNSGMHQDWRLGLESVRGWAAVRRTPGLIKCGEERPRNCAVAVDFRRLTGIRQWARIRPMDSLRAVLQMGGRC